MRDARTFLAVGGVVALVAVGALAVTVAGGGSGGDDSANGSVPVEDSVLVTTGPLMSTRMACEPALMAQERWVTEMLGSRPRLERSGPYLYVHWGEGEQWWLGLESANETFPAS